MASNIMVVLRDNHQRWSPLSMQLIGVRSPLRNNYILQRDGTMLGIIQFIRLENPCRSNRVHDLGHGVRDHNTMRVETRNTHAMRNERLTRSERG
jgi:hypothetical protein